jgi:copper chaperone CopZ
MPEHCRGPWCARTRVTLDILDLGCGGSRLRIIERSLAVVPGVLAVRLDVAADRAYVDCHDDLVTPAQLKDVVQALGFPAAVYSATPMRQGI